MTVPCPPPWTVFPVTAPSPPPCDCGPQECPLSSPLVTVIFVTVYLSLSSPAPFVVLFCDRVPPIVHPRYFQVPNIASPNSAQPSRPRPPPHKHQPKPVSSKPQSSLPTFPAAPESDSSGESLLHCPESDPQSCFTEHGGVQARRVWRSLRPSRTRGGIDVEDSSRKERVVWDSTESQAASFALFCGVCTLQQWSTSAHGPPPPRTVLTH